MKVRELQEQLDKLDPELDVICYTEDEGLLVKGRGFVLFDVQAVNKSSAERCHLDDGTPYLKLGKSTMSDTIAVIDVTSDF